MPIPPDWEAHFSSENLTAGRFVCPYCTTAATFEVLNSAVQCVGDLRTYHAVIRCNYAKCKKISYVETTKRQSYGAQASTDTFIMFPSRPIEQTHASIPSAVAEDWLEAQKAYNVGAVKAAAVMCRRVLYGVLLDKQCKERPMHEGIAGLLAKVRLPSIVEDWLKEIRDDGHDAAHPSRALIVPAENVTETMEYTKELLRFVYIEPAELQQRLARKASGQASQP